MLHLFLTRVYLFKTIIFYDQERCYVMKVINTNILKNG